MQATSRVVDYLNPSVPDDVTAVETPLVEANPETLAGYGALVDDPYTYPIEIVPWPRPGWRDLDAGTGDEGGTTEGIFTFQWDVSTYRGKNEAVADAYVNGWTHLPGETPPAERRSAYVWHANYHPDGGQLFYPLDGQAFVAPLALPGDDVTPDKFTAFYFDGSQGLYVHPGVWHEALFVLEQQARFFDKQGKVHARISVDFASEFGCLLKIPLRRPEVC